MAEQFRQGPASGSNWSPRNSARNDLRGRSWPVPLRIDPDLRVLDLEERAGLGRFVVRGQDRDAGGRDLAGRRIDSLAARGHDHPLDAEVAEARTRRPEPIGGSIADELDGALGGLHGDPVADRVLPAQTALVLE